MSTIATNIASLKTLYNLQKNENGYTDAVERLSSGLRINKAGDDAAGAAIVNRMTSQIAGMNVAIRNAGDAISMSQVAEGALHEVSEVLQRMRELAVQAASGISSNNDKDYLNLEMKQLVQQVDAISSNTKFNDRALLTGDTFTFYTDIDVAGTAITTTGADMAASALAVSAVTVSIGGAVAQTALSNVVSAIDNALATVDNRRAALGAVSNRFNHVIDNLQNVVMNTVASQSRIVDADYAVETTELTRNTVLQQAATAMLAQANAQKNSILALIQQ